MPSYNRKDSIHNGITTLSLKRFHCYHDDIRFIYYIINEINFNTPRKIIYNLSSPPIYNNQQFDVKQTNK